VPVRAPSAGAGVGRERDHRGKGVGGGRDACGSAGARGLRGVGSLDPDNPVRSSPPLGALRGLLRKTRASCTKTCTREDSQARCEVRCPQGAACARSARRAGGAPSRDRRARR
jgi:hypothetical protein